MKALFDIEALLPIIDGGALVLTPNKRLAAKIKQAYGAFMDAAGHSVWEPPRVHAEDQWISGLWDDSQDAGCNWACSAIISNVQRRQLFFQVARPSSEDLVMGITQLAVHTDAACRDMELWCKDIDELSSNHSGGRKLIEWSGAFHAELSKRNMVTREKAMSLIGEGFAKGDLSAESKIALIGFDQKSPLFLKVCSSASDDVIDLPLPGEPENVTRSTSRTPEDEITDAARWAKAVIKNDPSSLVGIIIPDLAQRKEEVDRLFAEVFEPHYLLPDHSRYTLPFNFSAGSVLLNAPVITDALSILDLHKGSWELDDICSFVRSPFWGGKKTSIEVRVDLERKLRNLTKPIIRMNDLRYYAGIVTTACGVNDDVCARLDEVKIINKQAPSSMRPSAWGDYFIRVLSSMGWPGNRRPDSVEYQQITAWYEALEAFSTLDVISSSFSGSQAIQHLKQILAGTTFQAKTVNGPIQILGTLEGSNLQYTHCRVLGMAMSTWPPAPAPNPLLPISFQRENQMPRCDAVRELDLAVSITASLARSAPTVIFSTPLTKDGNSEHVSPLVLDLPLDSGGVSDESGLHGYIKTLKNSKSLSFVRDGLGPKLEASKAKGGSGILKEQSMCPFNAFAQYRLGARSIERPQPGLSHRDRGNLLHDALAEVWGKWKSQAKLLALSDEAVNQDICKAVDSSIRKIFAIKPDVLADRFSSIERKRLVRGVWQLVEVDKNRSPFTVIGTERSDECVIGPLTLRVRLDRCDKLESGGEFIVDYKTSKTCSPKLWEGDRPFEPQLPLYAVTAKEPPSGVGFGACNSSKTEYRGVGVDTIDINGVFAAGERKYIDLPGSWDEILIQWNQSLENLAQEYNDGVAYVSFSNSDAERYSTDLLPLNRYKEIGSIQEYLASVKQ